MAEGKLHVEIVSKVEFLWQGEAHYVSVPAVDGRLGIMRGRQPVLAVLEPGAVEISLVSGETVSVNVEGGFASVDSDYVTVVVEGGALAG